MYTSCGWFFDEISGIETVQIIAYAGRVLQLARTPLRPGTGGPRTGLPRTPQPGAQSNVPDVGDGAEIYRRKSSGCRSGSNRCGALRHQLHLLLLPRRDGDLLLQRSPHLVRDLQLGAWTTCHRPRCTLPAPSPGGRATTRFAVLHLGDQNISAAVKTHDPDEAEAFRKFVQQASEQVLRANFPEVIRLLDSYYGHVDYSLTSLFTDEQRRIVQIILNSTLWDIEKSMTTIYEDHASLLHFLSQAGLPKPPALTLAAAFAINAGIRRALEADPIDEAALRSHLALANADQIALETATLSYIADQRMKRAMIELFMSSGSLEMLDRSLNLARIFATLPFELNLWQAQNIWYEILRTSTYALTSLAPEDRPLWDKAFKDLAVCLSIDPEAITVQDLAAVTTGD